MNKVPMKKFRIIYVDESTNRERMVEIDALSKYAAKKKFNHEHWGDIDIRIVEIKEVSVNA